MATPRPILNLTRDQCLELISFGNVMMVSLIVTIREFSPGWRHVCHGGCALLVTITGWEYFVTYQPLTQY